MPMFITPMISAPTTTPMILPDPPVIDAPPMKTAAITSSSNPMPALGVARVQPRRHDHAGQGRQHPHVDKAQEHQPVGPDARKLGGLFVAADAHRCAGPVTVFSVKNA